MMRRSLVVFFVALLLVTAALVWRYLPGLWPALGPVAEPSVSSTPATTHGSVPAQPGPLVTLNGWTSSLVTDGIAGARDMAVDPTGNVWVSQTSTGIVSLVHFNDVTPGVKPAVTVVLKGLSRPHGLAFDPAHPTTLYVAEETRISRMQTEPQGSLEKIADLPSGGRHFTRSLAFGADGRLYVSIGSSCDVCRETNTEVASIISMKPDGSDRRTEATGLRNGVFLAFQPHQSQSLWTTEMGRDQLGDHLPPDELDVIEVGGETGNYGWPICYGDRVHDTQFDKNQYIRDPCADTLPPTVELPAHVAPLGLAFLSDTSLLVSYHGSWNSSVPVGYKVVRWDWDGHTWTSEDFLTGFLKGGAAIGRPVDVLPMKDGSVLVSDDKKGAIWRVTPTH